MLVLVLAVPIWALSQFGLLIGSLKIPVTDLLLAFTPLIAALILIFRAEGTEGLVSFFKRLFDYRRLLRTHWLWPVLLLAPIIYGLTFTGLRLAGHDSVPVINFPQVLVLVAIIFVLAIGEEAGWTGYLLDPMQARFGALGASLIIAVPWWLAHIPSIIAIGGTTADIAWWLPGAIALRVLMTWLYNNAGRSTAAVILFHTMLNVGRIIVYPTVGSHYDTTYQITGYGVSFVLAVAVVIVWGPKNLTRKAPPSSGL